MSGFFHEDPKVDLIKAQIENDKITAEIQELNRQLDRLKLDQYNVRKYIRDHKLVRT